MKNLFLVISLLIFFNSAYAQLSEFSIPKSFAYQLVDIIPIIKTDNFDFNQLIEDDFLILLLSFLEPR